MGRVFTDADFADSGTHSGPRTFTESDFADPNMTTIKIGGPTTEELVNSDNVAPWQQGARVGLGGLSTLLGGLTFGLGDEAIAGGTAALDSLLPQMLGGTGESLSDAYDRRLGEVRGYEQAFQNEAPVASAAEGIGGSLLLPIKAITSAAEAPTLLGKLGTAAKEGAAIGGLYGFGNAEGGAEERLKSLGVNAAIGGAVAPAITLGASALSGLGKDAEQLGAAQQRRSVGARKSDYNKDVKGVVGLKLNEDGLYDTNTKAALDDLISRGEVGSSRDPQALFAQFKEKTQGLGKQIGSVIQEADGKITEPIKLKWDKAIDYLAKGGVDAREIDSYLNSLDEFGDAIARESGTSPLSYLQQQKVNKAFKYPTTKGENPGFERAVYADLQQTIEKYAPEVKPLNQELSKWKAVEPIFKRLIPGQEGYDPIAATKMKWATTGGYGVPIGLGVATGNLPLAAGGSILYESLMTPKGRQISGEVLKRLGKKAISAGSAIEKSAPVLALGAKRDTSNKEPKQPRRKGIFSPPPDIGSDLGQWGGDSGASLPQQNSATGPDLSRLMKALVKIESNGNPKATSPKGAQGLTQLMPATGREMAKKVGVNYEPYDKNQNLLLGTLYFKEQLDKFGTPELAYASYNAGPARVEKLLNRYGNDYSLIEEKLPKETQAYVEKAFKALNSMA